VTDSAVADHAGFDQPTRRALLGAGVIGAALAVAGSRSVSALSTGLSDDDLSLASFAISLELAARDLWDVALEAGADQQLWVTIRENHEAYAQRLAGITGISANTRDEALFSANAAGFGTNTPSIVGYDLESAAAATHLELLGKIDDSEIAGALASIAAIESRHAAVIAGLRGESLDAQFLNAAAPIAVGVTS
jgi:hypothetical protein